MANLIETAMHVLSYFCIFVKEDGAPPVAEEQA